MRWVLLVVSVVLLAAGATLAAMRHAVRSTKQVDRFSVTLVSPGLSAEQADESLGVPLERALRGVRGATGVRVVSRESRSMATVDLEWTLAEPLDARAALRAAVESLRPHLPEAVEVSSRRIPNDEGVQHHRWLVEGDALQTSQWVRDVLVRELESKQGVTSVEVCGLQESRVVVTVDPVQLNARGLVLTKLVRVLSDDARLRPRTAQTTLESLADTRFAQEGLSLGDLAALSVVASDSACLAWSHGRRVIVVDVTTEVGGEGTPPGPLVPPTPPAGIRLTGFEPQRSARFFSPTADASLAAAASENAVVRATGQDVEVLGDVPTTPGLTLLSAAPPATRLVWLGHDTAALRARALEALAVLEAKRPQWLGQPWPGGQVPVKTLRVERGTSAAEASVLAQLMMGGVRLGEVRDGAETHELWVKVTGGVDALPLLRLADGSPLANVVSFEDRTTLDAVLRVNGQRAVEVRVGLPESDVRAALTNGFPEVLIDSR